MPRNRTAASFLWLDMVLSFSARLIGTSSPPSARESYVTHPTGNTMQQGGCNMNLVYAYNDGLRAAQIILP
ncbi:hypothetical protein F5Y09DRAFT_301340 [Xylaria sp. FL1042]|nr:hypothetical protein F5Y09DRAFT_301340 [Xylaria sp. FL1042]